jgi:uncharacterized protein (TIGR04255 family)
MAMTVSQYRAPPIIDAVIELRFAVPLSDADRERVSGKFAKRYPLVEEVVQQHLQVKVAETGNTVDTIVRDRIFRHSTAETPDILQVGSRILSVASQAPYPGWEHMFERLVSDWTVARKVWGYRVIDRIGVRFINRIDLRADREGIVEYEQYLNLHISLPEDFPSIFDYNLEFVTSVDDIGCGVRVRSGIAEAGVPGGTSFLLDIDVWRQDEVPQKDAEVLSLLGEMRIAKNRLFETFITDEARTLFNAG